VAEDFAENHNVAADHRHRLIAMIGTWYAEAGKYGVLPVDGSGLARMIAEKPLVAAPRDRCTYRDRRVRSNPLEIIHAPGYSQDHEHVGLLDRAKLEHL